MPDDDRPVPLSYHGPPSIERPSLYEPRKFRHGGCVGGCLGAILLPLGLGIYCAFVLNDMGGPLFWPIVSIAGLLIGAAVGTLIHLVFFFWSGR
jgi:hypothetical protein